MRCLVIDSISLLVLDFLFLCELVLVSLVFLGTCPFQSRVFRWLACHCSEHSLTSPFYLCQISKNVQFYLSILPFFLVYLAEGDNFVDLTREPTFSFIDFLYFCSSFFFLLPLVFVLFLQLVKVGCGLENFLSFRCQCWQL